MARPRADAFDVDTQERILQSAERAFARRGYDRARLEDIAKVAGIRRPSLLYHFGSKERLYEAVIARVMGDLGASLIGAISQEASYTGRLQIVVGALTDFLESRPSTAPLILREILDGQGPGRDMLLSTAGPILQHLEDLIREVAGERLPEDLPVRQALLQVASGALVKNASGPLQAALWGPEDQTSALVTKLFVQ